MRGTRRGDLQWTGSAGPGLFERSGSLFSSDEEDGGCTDDGDKALSTLTRAAPVRAGTGSGSTDIDALLRDLQGTDDTPAPATPSRSRLWQSFHDDEDENDEDEDEDSAALDLEFENSALAAEKELDDFFASSDTLLSPLQRAARRRHQPGDEELFFRSGSQGSDADSDAEGPAARASAQRQTLLTEADLFGGLSDEDDDSECPLFFARSQSPLVAQEHAPTAASLSDEDEDENKEEKEGGDKDKGTEEAGTVEHATVETEAGGMSRGERRALESALRKYQATLETALGRNTKELTVFEERVRALRRQLQQDMAKFFSWENRTLRTRYRRFAVVQTAIFQCKEEILLEKSAALGGRLTDIRMLLDAAQKGARVTVQKPFYRTPAALFASPTILASEARLHALYKEKDRRVAQLREIVSKIMRVSTKERLARFVLDTPFFIPSFFFFFMFVEQVEEDRQ